MIANIAAWIASIPATNPWLLAAPAVAAAALAYATLRNR